MERREVNYLVKYIGDTYDEIINGKVYTCVAEWYDENGELHDLSVIDESGEDYLYFPVSFETV